jgi:hypothetical protein
MPAHHDTVRAERVPVRATLRGDLDDLATHNGEYVIRV